MKIETYHVTLEIAVNEPFNEENLTKQIEQALKKGAKIIKIEIAKH